MLIKLKRLCLKQQNQKHNQSKIWNLKPKTRNLKLHKWMNKQRNFGVIGAKNQIITQNIVSFQSIVTFVIWQTTLLMIVILISGVKYMRGWIIAIRSVIIEKVQNLHKRCNINNQNHLKMMKVFMIHRLHETWK